MLVCRKDASVFSLAFAFEVENLLKNFVSEKVFLLVELFSGERENKVRQLNALVDLFFSEGCAPLEKYLAIPGNLSDMKDIGIGYPAVGVNRRCALSP